MWALTAWSPREGWLGALNICIITMQPLPPLRPLPLLSPHGCCVPLVASRHAVAETAVAGSGCLCAAVAIVKYSCQREHCSPSARRERRGMQLFTSSTVHTIGLDVGLIVQLLVISCADSWNVQLLD